MTIYAPSDVRSAAVSESFGGCGQIHEAGDLQPGQRWGLDCPLCEVALSKPPLSSHGWSTSIDGVALTPDERRLLESQEKEGSAATAMMVRQLGDSLAAAMRAGYAGAAAPQPQFVQPSASDITAALKSMPKAELAEMLTLAGLAPTLDDAPAELVTAEPTPAPAKKVAAKKTAAKPAN